MKWYFTLGAIGIVLSPLGSQAAKYGTAGCGLGAVIFEDKPGKVQILAATINNIVSPQTSAITSGTSNCWEESDSKMAMYVAVNEQALRKDIAKGQGESLDGLAKILKCDSGEALGTALQADYEKLFPTSESQVDQTHTAIRSSIQSNPSLMNSCGSV